MTNWPGVVVPAVPPRPPQLTLLGSSVRPDTTSDPPNPVFEVVDHQMAMLPGDLAKELQAQQRDSWVRGISYAPENHFTALARDPCDFASVDTPALPAPTGLVTTPSNAGGTLTAAASPYSYQVTAVNANGETTALALVTATIAAGTTGSVVLTWNPTTDAVTYKVYGRLGGSIGLLATVTAPDDTTPTWTDTGSPAPGAAPPGSNTTGGPGTYTNLPIVNYQPYLIVVEDWCSTWGFEERDFKGRALRLLENATPQALEREFWGGALAIAKSYPNNYLTSSSLVDLTPGGGPPSVARGQQILQDYLATTGFGGQGMIHCQPQTAPSLLNARRVGNLLLDIYDNIIVPGVGYPGTIGATPVGTPAAGTAVMFATDLVMTRVEREGTVFPDTFAEATDWGQAGFPNTIRFRAMKFAAAYWDGAIQAGVRVTLAT